MELTLFLINSKYRRSYSSQTKVRVPFRCYSSKSENLHAFFSLPSTTFRQNLQKSKCYLTEHGVHETPFVFNDITHNVHTRELKILQPCHSPGGSHTITVTYRTWLASLNSCIFVFFSVDKALTDTKRLCCNLLVFTQLVEMEP